MYGLLTNVKMNKLINIKTGESHICDKVTIGGFDYYVSNEKAIVGFYGYINFRGGDIKKVGKYFANDWKRVVATNNPNISIPKVVDEADYYYPKLDVSTKEDTDNILLREGYNKAKETFLFTKEDMVEFTEWCNKEYEFDTRCNMWFHGSGYYETSDLIEIWQKQKPKVIYYEDTK